MNDAEAIKLAKNGREDGFKAIFANHGAFLYTHALRILKDRQTAEDAVQETFSAAFRSIESFRGDAKLRTWLYQILYHRALRLTERRQPALPINEEIAGNSDQNTRNVELKSDTEKILDQLSERDRSVLLLTYWDDLPLREVARLLEISENNAKVILFRARNRFASLWSAETADDKEVKNNEM